MTTLTTAMAALQYVAVQAFVASATTPMTSTEVILHSPFEIYKDVPAVYIYQNGGINEPQGLGTVSQYRDPRIRVEVFAGTYADVDTLVDAIRSAWHTDMNYTPWTNAAGTGYLRVTGGLKNLSIGEFQSSEWEKRGLVYRRIADVNAEIKGT